MVRFSDMLAGSGEPDDANAADSLYAALANDVDEPLEDDADETDAEADADAVKEPVPVATFETPEAVLDRLTQYATSRAAEQPAPLVESEATEPEPAPTTEPEIEPDAEADDALPPVGDDFLPSVRGLARRPGRGRKRHP
jgi:hypothetical protein